MTRSACAMVFHGAGQPFEPAEFPVPDPRGSEVLVEVTACTLCGSDLHTMQGRRIEPAPTILGHEILGRVVAFGPESSVTDADGQPLAIGDRVTWSIVASCGECFYCRRDLPQKCERKTKYGHEKLQPGRELTGGLADYCLLAAGTAIFRVPDRLDDATVCPANCATATVAGALDLAGPLDGRRVLVMGSGMLGVTAVAMARANGAEAVIACDREAERLSLAGRFGATLGATPEELTEVIADATSGYGVDVAIELTGSPEAYETMIPLVRVGGTAVLVGATYPARPVPVLLEQIVRRCLTLRGIHNYAPRHLRTAIEFLATHPEHPFPSLVSGWHPLGDLARIVSEGLPSGCLRLGIRPGMD